VYRIPEVKKPFRLTKDYDEDYIAGSIFRISEISVNPRKRLDDYVCLSFTKKDNKDSPMKPKMSYSGYLILNTENFNKLEFEEYNEV
jgi:hypothetical protein